VEVAAAIGLEEAEELHKLHMQFEGAAAPNCNILEEVRLVQEEDLLVVEERERQVKCPAQVVELLRVVEAGLVRAIRPIEEVHPSIVACWIAVAAVYQRKHLQYRVEEEQMTCRHRDPSIRPSELPRDLVGRNFVEAPTDLQLVVDLVQDHVEDHHFHLDHHPSTAQQ
jgi:hypothetical protein